MSEKLVLMSEKKALISEEKLFEDIMDSFEVNFRIMYSYHNTSRKYGTDQFLYMSEVHVIEAIGENPGLSLNDLAAKTFRSKSAMSMVVKTLAQKKLVKRERNQEDNRRYIINLTKKGQVVFDYHARLDYKNYSEILESMKEISDISLADLKKFYKILNIYTKVLSERK